VCAGVWTPEEWAAIDAKEAAWAAAAKAKVAKQQLKAKTKLSAAEVKKAEERERWMAEKKERVKASLAEFKEFIYDVPDQTVEDMRARELQQQKPRKSASATMKMYDERLRRGRAGAARGTSGSGAGSRSSSVFSTKGKRRGSKKGGGPEWAVFAAKREAREAAAKIKVAQQQSKSGTKLSAKEVESAVMREMWFAEKKERREKEAEQKKEKEKASPGNKASPGKKAAKDDEETEDDGEEDSDANVVYSSEEGGAVAVQPQEDHRQRSWGWCGTPMLTKKIVGLPSFFL
jgi:hypothetical protein